MKNEYEYKMIPVGKLVPNNGLSRAYPEHFTAEMRRMRKLIEKSSDYENSKRRALSNSIKEKTIYHNLVVRQIGQDSYEIIDGNNRYEDAVENGCKELMCLVIECDSEQKALEESFFINWSGSCPDPIQQAFVFKRLKDIYEKEHPESKQGGNHKQEGWVEHFSEKHGISRDVIYDRLHLFEESKSGKSNFGHLPDAIEKLIEDELPDKKQREDVFCFVKEKNMRKTDQVKEIIEMKKRTPKVCFSELYPKKDIIPPTALVNELDKITTRINKLLTSDFMYLNENQKMKVLGILIDLGNVVRRSRPRFEIAVGRRRRK
ncbi:MAG: ParB N-terminal domain-containing protein [Candidatus Aenigmatarchaeota archaeon]